MVATSESIHHIQHIHGIRYIGFGEKEVQLYYFFLLFTMTKSTLRTAGNKIDQVSCQCSKSKYIFPGDIRIHILNTLQYFQNFDKDIKAATLYLVQDKLMR